MSVVHHFSARCLLLVGSISLIASLFAFCSRAHAESPSVTALKEHLARPASERKPLTQQEFAQVPLTREDAAQTWSLLVEDRRAQLKRERAQEMQAGQITLGDKTMPIDVKTFGDKPATGRALVISMHGGGNAPAAVNDRQWKNQQRLYELAEGVYVAPRAPTNTWNLWHEGHIDPMFDRLIENLIVLEDVDPNRVYLTGYSAGGDGVYQLAPRMADRFAAAAMMAGHPNEASPLGLRNLPFTIHVGEKDSGYNRNKVAQEWEVKLKELHEADSEGYEYRVKLHAGLGHWMNREDAEAIIWMVTHTRNPFPKKVVWRQDDVLGSRFYWLATSRDAAQAGQEVVATIDGQTIRVTAPEKLPLRLRLNDRLVNLDQPLEVFVNEKLVKTAPPVRTIAVQASTLLERFDPTLDLCAEVLLSTWTQPIGE